MLCDFCNRHIVSFEKNNRFNYYLLKIEGSADELLDIWIVCPECFERIKKVIKNEGMNELLGKPIELTQEELELLKDGLADVITIKLKSRRIYPEQEIKSI